jgi:uncharacterized RDD family membrane protein YckC
VTYPNVLRRWLGTVLDWIFIFVVLIAIAKLGVEPESEGWVMALVVVFVLLYEPLLTIYGCTLGQFAMRMRVRDETTLGRITLSQAYYRIFVKYFLGWISVLTLPFQKRRQAIHDLVTGTLVVEARDSARRELLAPVTKAGLPT